MWLPGNMKTLPRGMFKGCSSLSSVTLPQYLLSIDDYAFDGCSSLVDIKLPIYLNSLGYRALADCSKLTSLDLPSSLQNIGSYAFAGCNAMERIDANMAAPITASQSTFNGVDFSNCYLYVPTGAYQSYWLANGWGSFEHIIDNLAPQKSKMVTLETAGTLRDKIGSNEKFSITHLKVSGPINTNDIQYIREMAGCYYDTNGSKYNAYLHHLDLRDASYSGDGPMIEVYGPNGYKYYMYIQAQENAVRTTHLFFCLDGLQTVILPNNEEEIGETMFGLCNNLKNIEMSRVQTIRFDAFEGCSSLEALQLPYGITSLEDAVFADCSSLKEINIPSSVTTICDWAFENCRSLTSITIPDNVTSIGKSAFGGCSNLKSLYLPANIKTIGDAAFNGCGSLTRINAKMKDPVAIGEDTFTGLDYDKCELLVPEGSAEAYRQAAVWSNFNNITDITVVVTDNAGLLQYMIEKNDKNYKNNITRLKVIGHINIYDIQCIREMAGCWLEESGKKTDGNLQYLDLQEAKLVGSDIGINVYTNGSNQGENNTIECTAKIEPDGNHFSNLFRNVSKLNTVIMPEYLTTTGSGTFMDSPLSSITLPKNLTSIGNNAFNGCGGLRDISIPSGVTSIGKGAFKGCGLKEFTLPKQVNEITDEMFSGCNKLESFYFKGGVPTTLSEALIPTTCIIYVPTEYLQDYKDALGADYKYVYTWNPNGSGEGDKPVTKCATPTVSYESGELKFACETVGAKYHYTISDKDMATDAYSENGEVGLSAAYEISVYATADGYSASEKAQATLYWLNANLKDATNINMAKTRGVVASAHDGIVSVSGLDNGEEVKFYAADGKFIGQAVAANGTASYAVSEALVIAKVGNNSIKIAMK